MATRKQPGVALEREEQRARTRSPTAARGSVLSLFGSGMLAQALGLLLAPVLARALGPTRRGQVALVTVYDDASTALFNLGVPSAVGFYAKEGHYSEAELLATAIRIGLWTELISLPAGAATVYGPLSGVDVATRVLSFILVGFSPMFALLGVTARQILVTRGDLAGLRATNVLQAALRALCIGIAYATGNLTLPTAVIAISYSTYLGTFYCVYRCHVRPHWPGAPAGVLVRYGMRALPLSLANLSNGRLEQLMIAPLLGAHLLGIYAVGVTVNSVMLQFGQALALDSFRRVPAEEAPGRAAAAKVLRRAWIAVVAMAVMIAVVVFVGLVPVVFGRPYAEATWVSLLLIPGTIAASVAMVAQQVATAIGRPGVGSAGTVCGVLFLCALVPVGVDADGLLGAAGGATIAYCAGLAVALILLRRVGVRRMFPKPSDGEFLRDLRSALVARVRQTAIGGNPNGTAD